MPKDTKSTQQRMFGMTDIIRGIGVVVILIGVYVIYLSNKPQPEPSEPLWWTGLAIFVLGLHIFFFSKMPKHQIYDWLKSETVALGLALLIRWPIAEPYRIPSSSMEPTLHGDYRFGRGDRVFVNKWIYGVRFPFMNKRIWYGKKPERWEIVVFKTVEKDAKHKTLVKRVVGLPGERVHISGGKVYINGKPLELPPDMPDIYYTSGPAITGMEYGIRTEDKYSLIPEGHYFVLGDNSAYSRDGRFFGWVPNEHIVGRVSCIWWPPSRWRDFTGFSKTWWWRTSVVLVIVLLVVRLFFARSIVWYGWKQSKLCHYVVNQLAYGFRIPFTKIWLTHWTTPMRGDWIAYWLPQDVGELTKDNIIAGIVVGIENDKISIQNGKVLVNGKESEYIHSSTGNIYPAELSPQDAPYGLLRDKEHSVVPPGHVFVVWSFDHSSDHAVLDSRKLGWIPLDKVVGKISHIWFPPTQIGTVKMSK